MIFSMKTLQYLIKTFQCLKDFNHWLREPCFQLINKRMVIILGIKTNRMKRTLPFTKPSKILNLMVVVISIQSRILTRRSKNSSLKWVITFPSLRLVFSSWSSICDLLITRSAEIKEGLISLHIAPITPQWQLRGASGYLTKIFTTLTITYFTMTWNKRGLCSRAANTVPLPFLPDINNNNMSILINIKILISTKIHYRNLLKTIWNLHLTGSDKRTQLMTIIKWLCFQILI